MEKKDLIKLTYKDQRSTNDNAHILANIGKNLDNRLALHDKNYQVGHDSNRSVTLILNNHLKEVGSLHVATESELLSG